jgi:flagellin
MTAINTNTAALNAQYYLAKSNKDMESSMAKLSSGQKVNSAADDAAGLAIASRMTSQIKGLAMAVKNSNDSMSLAQTAEGAMEEVTNMLQRIRELAVQSANGTMNSSDRASLDAEVQALKTEIDRVANTTTFNSQKLLDGSYTSTFQIGDKGGQTVDLSINSVSTSALGMGDGASSSKSVVSARLSLDSSGTLNNAIEAGDVVINGQALGAFATTDDVEAIVTNINTNVDNVTASAFNVVVAKNIGDGVTGGAASSGLTLKTREMGATADTTFVISASSSMTELVNNINNETGGVINAEVNSDGKLVLSNNTGAFISVEDDSSSVGSGFADHSSSAVQHNGFLKIESNDGSNIRIERGNTALSSPGTLADLQAFGLNETINTTATDGYTVVGEALKSKTVHLTTREITRGKAEGTVDEVQHVVNITADVLADMANSTVTLNDGNGQSVSHTFTSAPANIDALRDALNTLMTSHDGVGSNTDFGLAITDGLTGTDLEMTFDLAGETNDKNVSMASLSYTKSSSGLETSVAKGDLTLNGVEIFNTDIASNSFGGKLNLINSFSAETGVVASATFDQTFIVDPNNIIKGDVIKINGTEVEVTTSNDIAALVTALNGRTDATGLTASRSGNNITLKGENVQSLTIGQKSKAEISDTLVSAVSAKAASNSADRTLTIDASDLQVGRTYVVAIANSGDAESPAASVTVTAASGETTSTLATKIATALRGADEKYRDGTDANNISVSSNVITFNGASGSKLDAGQADITFKANSVGDIFGTSDGADITSYGSLKLDSTANTPIKIDLGEVTTAANHKLLHGFLEANVGAADYDVNAPQLSASGGTSMAGLSVGTATGATAALATLDRAIDSVNANRGTLGALQNRLEYTINNLSSISNATSGAKGRIMDADFAVETSQLTKNQILSQAATSMLAQANQSKQGILALLQG